MKIIGIDPGYATIGYGIVDYRNTRFTTLDYGAVITTPDHPFPERLLQIYEEICAIMERHRPEAAAIEKLFFSNNKTTGIDVAQARGVILVVGCKKNVPTYEYTPLQIKQSAVGYGRADQIQVQKIVKTILGVDKLPKLDDTTDSMAAAICHAHSSKFSIKL